MFALYDSDSFALERHRMVETQLRARGIRDQNLLTAMANIPRHEFAEACYQQQAYEDHPLPIASGQTISQPYIVALMLELLQLGPFSRVLEIGTGSGYQTAVLTQLCAHVYSIERHADLSTQAARVLARMGFGNVTVVNGDGTRGWAEYSPFDAIVVSAATSHIPPDLLEQLREGGRMIIPLGSPEEQELQLVRKQDGKAIIAIRGACRFVPLIRDPDDLLKV